MNKNEILVRCNALRVNTLMETLQIEYTDVGEDFLTARMPVNARVYQPDGVLHGGATVALAESVGSAAAFVFLDAQNVLVRGVEISANHVKSAKAGFVYATASLRHKGRTLQLWHIPVVNENQQLISEVKLTTITLPK